MEILPILVFDSDCYRGVTDPTIISWKAKFSPLGASILLNFFWKYEKSRHVSHHDNDYNFFKCTVASCLSMANRAKKSSFNIFGKKIKSSLNQQVNDLYVMNHKSLHNQKIEMTITEMHGFWQPSSVKQLLGQKYCNMLHNIKLGFKATRMTWFKRQICRRWRWSCGSYGWE